jgi:hypothetical protein
MGYSFVLFVVAVVFDDALIDGMIFLLINKKLMEKQSSRGRSQDRRKIAGGQDYEVNYESRKTGSSKKEVKEAVKRKGNERKNVEKSLK